VDKDTIVCVMGAVVLLALVVCIGVLAWKNARVAPPTLVDKLPKIINLWRTARSAGERALIVLAMIGTAIRRGGQFVVALGVIGLCVNGFAALCSASSLEVLREAREILRDLLYAFGRPVRPIN
jgi:hypothetical protein